MKLYINNIDDFNFNSTIKRFIKTKTYYNFYVRCFNELYILIKLYQSSKYSKICVTNT